MSNILTEYEERTVMDIAHWKAEKPSRVSRALEFFRKPLNEVTGRVVSGSAMRSVCAHVEAIVNQQKGPR